MNARRLAAATLAAAVLLGGCSIGGLPGGAGRGGYQVDAIFGDVLDLVPDAAVKVDDITVGTVESVTLVDFQARVRMRIDPNVTLPADAVATLRQTSLLGEKFVELAEPEGGGTGRLADGAVIPIGRTTRNPEVEEVFQALAAVLNGGGLTEIQTIAVELSRALAGREQNVRSVLRRLDTLVSAFDERKSEIVRAIDALDRLTATLAEQRSTIAQALDEFTPALTVLADQREDLTLLLTKLSRLGAVGSRVIERSRDDTLADLRMLAPIVHEVARAKTDLAATIDQLVAFTRNIRNDIPSDYLQLLVTLYVSPETTPFAKPGPGTPAAPAVPRRAPTGGGSPPDTTPSSLTDLLLGGVR